MIGAPDIIEPGEFVDFNSPIAWNTLAGLGLRSEWDFSAGSGNGVRDLFGRSPLTLGSGAKWVGAVDRSGCLKTAISSNECVGTVTNIAALAGFTCSAWVYNSGVAGNYSAIFSFDNNWRCYFGVGSSNTFDIWLNNSQNVGGGTLPLNRWTHVTFVYRSAAELSVYCDGVRVFTTASPQAIGGSPTAIHICGDSYIIGNFEGLIGSAQFFDRAMSQGEVRALFNLECQRRNWVGRPPVVPAIASAGGRSIIVGACFGGRGGFIAA